MTGKILVLVADDHPVYRNGLRAQFETAPGMEIAEATCAKEAVTLVAELNPAVTLLDLRMPRSPGEDPTFCGIETIREIRLHDPAAIVLLLTRWSDVAWIHAAIDAGAHGYLLKEVDDTHIVALVAAAACGVTLFSSEITGRMPDIFRAVQAPPSRFPELTPQLIAVARRVALGESDETIGRVLGIAAKTVRNYVSQIFARLGVTTRAELVALVRDRLPGEAP